MAPDELLARIQNLQLEAQEQLEVTQAQTAHIAQLAQQVEQQMRQADKVLNQEREGRSP